MTIVEAATPYPRFNRHSERIDLTDRIKIGSATSEVFAQLNKPYRETLRLELSNTGEETLVIRPLSITDRHDITASAMATQTISADLFTTIRGVARTENRIDYYLIAALKETQYDRGLSDYYKQLWGPQETGHGKYFEFILKNVKVETRPDPKEGYDPVLDYYETNQDTWEPPYPNRKRQTLAYSWHQEGETMKNYLVIAARARAEGAPLVAEAFEAVAGQEGRHQVDIGTFIKTYYEFDRQGTKEDVLHATRIFRMPIPPSITEKDRLIMRDVLQTDNSNIGSSAGRLLRAVGATEEEIKGIETLYFKRAEKQAARDTLPQTSP